MKSKIWPMFCFSSRSVKVLRSNGKKSELHFLEVSWEFFRLLKAMIRLARSEIDRWVKIFRSMYFGVSSFMVRKSMVLYFCVSVESN